jgi:pectate lyase
MARSEPLFEQLLSLKTKQQGHLTIMHMLNSCCTTPALVTLLGTLALLIVPRLAFAVPAFPEARGGGAASVGGRGGAVIEVTNLSDSGAGSLRACIQTSGPRTCVFRVAGTINVLTPMVVSNPNITIAGQSAPGGGILISGKNMVSPGTVFVVETTEVIVRYLRIAKGYQASCGDECGANLVIWGGPNVIIDHVTSLWNMDESIAAYNSHGNMTFSWNLLAEGLSDHATGFLAAANDADAAANMTNQDFHHNLSMNNTHRNPLLRNKSTRFVNNLVYNTQFYRVQIGGGVQADIVGNLFKQGPLELTPTQRGSKEIQAYFENSLSVPGPPSMYLLGNKGPNQTDPRGDQWLMAQEVAGENGAIVGAIPRTWQRVIPLRNTTYPIVAEPAADLEANVLATVGASQRLDCDGRWVANRSSVETRLINQYAKNTGNDFIPENEDQVGGYPVIVSAKPCADADHDGMPDVWEKACGLNLNDAADRNRIAPNGYTALENYLNGTDSRTSRRCPSRAFLSPFDVSIYDHEGSNHLIQSSGRSWFSRPKGRF